jgi:hypothetical protein
VGVGVEGKVWQVRPICVPHVCHKADVIRVLLFGMLVPASRGCMVLCMFSMHLPNFPVIVTKSRGRDTRISRCDPMKRDAYSRQGICQEQNSHQILTLRLSVLISMRHFIYDIADISYI